MSKIQQGQRGRGWWKVLGWARGGQQEEGQGNALGCSIWAETEEEMSLRCLHGPGQESPCKRTSRSKLSGQGGRCDRTAVGGKEPGVAPVQKGRQGPDHRRLAGHGEELEFIPVSGSSHWRSQQGSEEVRQDFLKK